MLPLYWKTAFLGLHGIYPISVTKQYQLMWQIIFHSVRSSAGWTGLRHALRACLGRVLTRNAIE